MTHILFVCTGNVFRSLTAELALRSILPPDSGITVSSAGTNGFPARRLRDDVVERLTYHGLDYNAHHSRRLTRALLDSADLVVAMSTDHVEYIREHFGRDVLLYKKIVTGVDAPFLDLWEEVPNYKTNVEASRQFIHSAIDMIVKNREVFLRNMFSFLNSNPKQGPTGPQP